MSANVLAKQGNGVRGSGAIHPAPAARGGGGQGVSLPLAEGPLRKMRFPGHQLELRDVLCRDRLVPGPGFRLRVQDQ